MKKVVLRAPALTQSGYGVHSRQVARWLIGLAERSLISLHIQCVPWGDTTWFIDHDAQDGLIGKIMKYSSGEVPDADVSFQVILPNEWDPKLAKFNVGITAGIETDRCNPMWVHNCNQMNEVIVPSNHTMQSFKNSGFLSTKMSVIPESFPDALIAPHDTDKLNLSTDFNLLVFGQLTSGKPEDDRKNIFKTLSIIIEALKDKDDVGIVLKSNLGRSTIMDYKYLQGSLTSLLNTLGHKGSPKIYLLHGNMSDEDLRDLYKNPKIKGLVSLTRGEGFGLPLLEAAACGVPIVATKWSSYTDFLTGDSYLKVKYDLVEISNTKVDQNLFQAGTRWAEAKASSALENIQKLYKHYSIYEKRAADHKSFIIENYNFQAIERQYQDKFGEILCS